MLRIRTTILALTVAFLIATSSAVLAGGSKKGNDIQSGTAREIRKELVTLPYYGVFDNLAFKLEGDTVILYGQVVRPTTRKDAEKRIAKIEGVERVINNIEVLPLSRFDDSIRLRTYRAVFGAGSLYRYGQGVNPSIHIIVKNGHVSLEGIVATEGDKNLAGISARGVPGSFSVTNNLKVERRS
ncbi:MAG: BON domain-containing protein [Acidobacteriota bacterium]